MLTVGAGGGCLDIFLLSITSLFFLPLSLGYGPIWTEILSQRAVKPKTTNQSKSKGACMQMRVRSVKSIYSSINSKAEGSI